MEKVRKFLSKFLLEDSIQKFVNNFTLLVYDSEKNEYYLLDLKNAERLYFGLDFKFVFYNVWMPNDENEIYVVYSTKNGEIKVSCYNRIEVEKN